jgi:hypothetical protein
MEYFDSRGVRRTYGVSLDAGVLRFRGEFPEFAQRFCAAVRRDSFQGQWQVARTPGDWQDDLNVSYRRRDCSSFTRRSWTRQGGPAGRNEPAGLSPIPA